MARTGWPGWQSRHQRAPPRVGTSAAAETAATDGVTGCSVDPGAADPARRHPPGCATGPRAPALTARSGRRQTAHVGSAAALVRPGLLLAGLAAERGVGDQIQRAGGGRR